MWVRYNDTEKYWEKSTDNVNFTPLEENNGHDGDRKFGSTLSADVDGAGASIRHFTFDGNSKIIGQISIGAAANAASGAGFGLLAFHNRNSGSADKRTAIIAGYTDVAHNSGAMVFFTALSGALAEQARIDKDGNFWVGTSTIFDAAASGGVLKRLSIDGNTIPAQISVGATRTGTSDLVGTVNFFNRTVAASDKRVGFINCVNDGATNTTRLAFFNVEAGSQKERMRIMGNGTISAAMQGAIATTATGGFFMIPQCAGTPTGVPAGGVTAASLVYDTTNKRLFAYNTITAAWNWVQFN